MCVRVGGGNNNAYAWFQGLFFKDSKAELLDFITAFFFFFVNFFET